MTDLGQLPFMLITQMAQRDSVNTSIIHLYSTTSSNIDIVLTTIKWNFVGYMVSSKGISMDRKKVQMILDWKSLASVCDMQCFLGFANFNRKLIRSYSKVGLPLTKLTQEIILYKLPLPASVVVIDERCRENRVSVETGQDHLGHESRSRPE